MTKRRDLQKLSIKAVISESYPFRCNLTMTNPDGSVFRASEATYETKEEARVMVQSFMDHWLEILDQYTKENPLECRMVLGMN